MALRTVLDSIDPVRREIARQLLTELFFMKGQLAKLRRQISEQGAVEHFRQGDRAEFDRQTPAFRSYVQLIARFSQLHKQLEAMLPAGEVEQMDELDEFLSEM